MTEHGHASELGAGIGSEWVHNAQSGRDAASRTANGHIAKSELKQQTGYSIRLLIFDGGSSALTDEDLVQIQYVAGGVSIEIAKSPAELRKRLTLSRAGIVAVLLYLSDRHQLAAMLEMRDLLIDTRLFLISAGLEGSMLTLAHRLHPRFVMGPNRSPNELYSVLSKTLGGRLSGIAETAAAFRCDE